MTSTTGGVAEPMPSPALTVEQVRVNAVIVSKKCACGGHMVYGGIAFLTHPPQYPHTCNACGETAVYREIYPRLDYVESE